MGAEHIDRFALAKSSNLVEEYVAELPRSAAAARPLFRSDDGQVAAQFFNCRLASAFQPIVDVARGVVVGHHGLLRILGSGDAPLAPWNLFALAVSDAMLRQLDRLCRTIHVLNYFPHASVGHLLVLNVEQRLLASVPDDHGKVFEGILAEFGLTPKQVVIDFPRSVLADPWLLENASRNYRSRGYRVAVPTNSWDESTLRLLEGVPTDIVKVDVVPGMAGRRLRGFATGLREQGILLLARRVESSELLDIVSEAGVDLVQGFRVGQPRPVARAKRCHRSVVDAGTPAGSALSPLRFGHRMSILGREVPTDSTLL
ncbi:MAG: EAL domain-containing protein [Burkholderiales bacterium]